MLKLITSFQIKILLLALTVLLVPQCVKGQQIIYQDASRIVWRIDRPEVTQRRTEYPQITFRRLDEVIVEAGGCVQTGGFGDTWKRYVNPAGNASDRLYHGLIFIPGATAGMVRISSITRPYQPQPLRLVVNKFPAHYDGSSLYLQLGYEDGDYGDNGYWGHDDGNPTQCRYQDDGGPAWLIITIIHHDSSNPPPPSPTPVAPLDLWWDTVDQNFLPLNPSWWYLITNGSPPDGNAICTDWHNENDALPAGKSPTCTLWDPWVNERGFLSLCGPSSNTVAGHINWASTTYMGRLYFSNFSGSIPFDADYNFSLIRDDLRGSTDPTDAELIFEGKPGIGLEFNTRETVDVMDGTGTWWDLFHHTVDQNQNAAREMVRGRPSIALGLFGIDHNKDHEIDAHSESHPVFGLAINVGETADVQKWAVFARNSGDQGACSQQLEFLTLRNNRMKLFFPKPDDTTIAPLSENLWVNYPNGVYAMQPFDDGILVTMPLPVPEARGLLWGDINFKREKADLRVVVSATPDPVVTGSNPTFTQGLTYTITISNNGPDRAHPVTLKDALPSSTQFISCTATSGGVCSGTGNNREVRFPSIAPGTSVRATIRVYVDCALDTGDTISNTATVTSATLDPDPSNNTATIQTTASDPPPVFTHVPPDVSVCTEPNATTCGTVVDPALLGMATADDNCPGVTVERTGVPANNYYPVGTTVITYTARDSHNHTTVAYQRVIVRDCTPPVVTPLEIDKPVLWPANHQMEFVTVDYVVTDNCPLPPNACVLSATSDEPISGTGPGDFSPDWQIEDAHHAYIRSERAGDNKERHYTLTATCTDAAGNVTTQSSRVTIPLTAPLVETEKTQQSNLIQNALIQALPNIDRDFTSYLLTLPGVTDARSARAQTPTFGIRGLNFAIGGHAGSGSEVTIDGGESLNGLGNIRSRLSPEAVREINVQRNSFPAEWGFTSQGAVDFVTHNGTNDFQVSGYAFYQPENTTARNPFTFTDNTDRRIVGGFTTAGPIAEGKAYLFSSYEYWSADLVRFRDYLSSPQLRPSTAQLRLLDNLDTSGDANTRRIASNLRAALTTSAANYPTTIKLLTDNSGTFVSNDRLHSWLTRVDYQVTNQDWLMGRLLVTQSHTSRDGILGQMSPSRSNTTALLDYTTLLTWTHEIRVNFLNRARFQFSPHSSERIVPSNPAGTSLSITDFALFGRTPDSPFRAKEDRFQFDDQLTRILPQHTITAGGSYRAAKYNVSSGFGFAGDWTFSPGQFSVLQAVPTADRPAFLAAAGTNTLPSLTGLQSFNLDLPSQYRQGFGDPVWKARAQYLGVFVEDLWRTNPRLTINFGGRIDYAAEPSPLPHDGFVSPRLGIAWDVEGNGKTVIRGGIGTFYGHDDYNGALHGYFLGQNGRYINELLRTSSDGTESSVALWAAGRAAGILPFGSLSQADLQRLGISTGSGAASRVLYQVSPNFNNPYSLQTSIGIQRTLWANTSIEAAYLMYNHFRVPRTVETNYRESNLANPAGSAFGPRYIRIDPNVAQLNGYQSTGRAKYHGMTLSLNRRLANYFQTQANYTLSKTTDDQFDGVESEPAFPTRLDLERSLSSFDVRHDFVASGVFTSPWTDSGPISKILSHTTIAPIIRLRSGSPFTLRTGADTNGDTHLFDRLFAIGRNTGIGPDYRSVDLRLTKSFYFGSDDGLKLLLSADVENLFNRSNFAVVNEVLGTDLSSPDYNLGTFKLTGLPDRHRTLSRAFTDAFPARRFQFGLKFVF